MKSLRLRVHRANIARYEDLLACDLTLHEHRYLEQLLEQERSAVKWLFGAKVKSGIPQMLLWSDECRHDRPGGLNGREDPRVREA